MENNLTKDSMMECLRHGLKRPTFICRHLQYGKELGFNRPAESLDPEWPFENAWCDKCDEVLYEDLLMNIWRNNPGMITHDQALNSEDGDIKEFAKSPDENYLFIDIRNAKIGDGFSWGRCGPKTVNKRFGEKRIFAYEIRKSFWQRLIKK